MATVVTLTAVTGYGGSFPVTTIGWSQFSGPGTATIDTPLALTTTVTLPTVGDPDVWEFDYKITIDGMGYENRVKVTTKTNDQPVVDAGTAPDTFQDTTIAITGIVTDDGLPAPTSRTDTWSAAPSNAVFGDVNDLTTTVSFPDQDTYVLTLTSNDGTGDVTDTDTVIVAAANALGTGYDSATPDAPGSELTDFTWSVDLSDLSTTWWSTVNSTDGRDIRVTDGNDVSIPFDLNNFVDNGTTGTGVLGLKLTATVSPPDVRIWVGNTALIALPAADPLGQYATYDSTYAAFYPDGGGNDRTINANHLTMFGNTTTTADSKSGFTSTVYDGTGDYGIVQSTDFNTGKPATASLTGMANVAAGDTFGCFCGLGHTNGGTLDSTRRSLYIRRRESTDLLETIHIAGGGGIRISVVTGTLADATWGHFAGTIDASFVDVWLNAAGNDAAQGTYGTTGDHDVLTLGINPRLNPVAELLTGELCAVGVHTAKRSDDWLDYQQQMLNDQNDFWNLGGGTWTWTAA